MNYTGQKVKHKTFGNGEVISQDSEDRIIVRFSDGNEREFGAPKCFESFLTLLDSSIQDRVKDHIEQRKNREKAEAEERRRASWEKALNAAAERKSSGKDRTIQLKSYATLGEFFDAQKADLEQEAGYLRATGGKRYRITDGELISFSGDRYVYSFESDTELNLPDSIGITLWKGDQALTATLVNCEDFSLVISCSTSLGRTVPEIEFSSEPWRLLYDLNERLDSVRRAPSGIVKSLILEGRKKTEIAGSLRKGQENAIRLCRTEPIVFLWGPPGTGKTETLANIVLEHIDAGERVLMLSYSNVSVDEAALRVLGKDRNPQPGKLIRYGYPRKKKILEHEFLSSYNYCLMSHLDLVKKRRQLMEERKRHLKNSRQYLQIGKELTQIREQLKEEEKQAVTAASFVATTVSKAIADHTIHEKASFDTVIFDEASMAYIPQIIFAASLAKRHFICIGDFAQLPPIVQSSKESRLNADIFQYCEITDAVARGYGHEWLCMLNVQHRMHPEIADFVSARMYQSLLESAPDMKAKREEIVRSQPFSGEALAIADLSGMMSVCIKTRDQSRINVLSALLAMGMAIRAAEEHEVGIITPYNAQSRLLHAMSRDLAEQDETLHRIVCATVHQFQGSEKDVIIYDAVDCYRSPYPGLMISLEKNNYANRLFNVAMTRARGKMISLVNADYMVSKKLSISLIFRQLIEKFSFHPFRGKQILQEMDQDLMKATDGNSLDDMYFRDLQQAKDEIRIDIPGRMETEPAAVLRLATILKECTSRKICVIIRAEKKQELPATIRSMAIENEFVANPVTLIDRKISWFGEPASGARFIVEGRALPVWCRPVIRIEGKHCARALYNFLEMSQTIDGGSEKNEKGSYDTFAAYVRGEIKCEVCERPMELKKTKHGKFFLNCSSAKCPGITWVKPEMVDNYLFFDSEEGRICPEDGTTLTAGQGKKNVYVGCNCGGTRHYWRLDEI